MPTIAIVGAGPGMGLAIARRFGAEGFDIALVSRTQSNLDKLVATLSGESFQARGFAADVNDPDSLTAALQAATNHFGQIDVLEYSPVDPRSGLQSPSEATAEGIHAHMQSLLYGALTATRAVLPGMTARATGTLLFTTGAGSITPNPMLGNVNAAGASLRNWVLNLDQELAGTGVHAAHIAIAAWIGDTAPEGAPSATADQIAPAYWDLHVNRDRSEHVFTA